jgi:hypothetical protein
MRAAPAFGPCVVVDHRSRRNSKGGTWDEEESGRTLRKEERERCTMHAVRDVQLHVWTVSGGRSILWTVRGGRSQVTKEQQGMNLGHCSGSLKRSEGEGAMLQVERMHCATMHAVQDVQLHSVMAFGLCAVADYSSPRNSRGSFSGRLK